MATYCCPRCRETLQASAASSRQLRCPSCQLGYHLVRRPATQPGTAQSIRRTHRHPFVSYLTICLAILIILGVGLTCLVAFHASASTAMTYPSNPVSTHSATSKSAMVKIEPAMQTGGNKTEIISPADKSKPASTDRALFEMTGPDPQINFKATNENPIDALVFAKLRENKIEPAALCSDAVFVRRVFIDVLGTLPTADEARGFIKDTNPRKRQLLIDQVLTRKEYVDYWAMKWGDILRIKSEFPINLWPNAARAYHHWVYACLRDNLPYDKMAKELLTSSGSNFRSPAVNFYRAVQGRDPQSIARTVALTFMGIRPETWKDQELQGFSTFFGQIGFKSTQEWKEEIVYFDDNKPRLTTVASLPDGSALQLVQNRDPRQQFADWLITPQNPWYTRTVVNRVWAWLLVQDIVHVTSDKSEAHSNYPELLAFLEKEFIAAKYDLKHLYRIILNTHTYQFSCIPSSREPQAETCFASYPVRRLEAEVLIDAICQITGSTEKYSSPIPEPFSYYPSGQRAICLPDGSITSPFLELFGRPARDTGLESERNNTITAAQRLHLLNSAHIQRAIERGPRLTALFNARMPPRELADQLYLTILSRYPSTEESLRLTELLHKRTSDLRPVLDVVWSLINSSEFLFRH